MRDKLSKEIRLYPQRQLFHQLPVLGMQHHVIVGHIEDQRLTKLGGCDGFPAIVVLHVGFVEEQIGTSLGDDLLFTTANCVCLLGYAHRKKHMFFSMVTPNSEREIENRENV